MNKLTYALIGALMFVTTLLKAQEVVPQTYCNPLDIDYTYMVYNSSRNISYRSGRRPGRR